VTAVDLFSPDLEGARRGTFPYIMWPGACGYGVGAGCFQHGLRPDAIEFRPATSSGHQLSLDGFKKEAGILDSPPRKKQDIQLRRPPTAKEERSEEIVLTLFAPHPENLGTMVLAGEEDAHLPVIDPEAGSVGVGRAIAGAKALMNVTLDGGRVYHVAERGGRIGKASVLKQPHPLCDWVPDRRGDLTWMPLQNAFDKADRDGEWCFWITESWALLGRVEATERAGEYIIRPIAFWSRSLSGSQLGWDTWERELWSIRESTYSWRSFVGGCWCLLLPDALNNVILSQGVELRQPAKNLRWILDIEGRIIARWGFGPGRANFIGDGPSRDVEERDALRPDEEVDLKTGAKVAVKQGLPLTLKDAFTQARSVQIDRDQILQGRPWAPGRFKPTQVIEQNATMLEAPRWPMRTPSGRRVLDGLYLPSLGTNGGGLRGICRTLWRERSW
jgi:hypothetical protein